MASLIIQGKPLASFEFEHLPSWNDAIAAARGRGGHWSGSKHTKKWRAIGHQMASEFLASAWTQVLGRPVLIEQRAMVVVKVFRPTDRTYDVHNVYTKAVFDGFSDAGIWRDDSWKWLPWVVYGYVEQDELDMMFVGKAFVIEVYELERVILNGVEQTLREWS